MRIRSTATVLVGKNLRETSTRPALVFLHSHQDDVAAEAPRSQQSSGNLGPLARKIAMPGESFSNPWELAPAVAV